MFVEQPLAFPGSAKYSYGGKKPIYIAIMVEYRQCLEDSEQKDHLMNHGGAYRTAPATPGL